MEQATRKRARRSNHEGTVYEAEEWRAALVLTDPSTGRVVRRPVTGGTRAEVERKLTERRRQLAADVRATATEPREYHRLRGALVVPDPRTGTDVRRSVSGRTRAEVTRKLSELRRATDAGALPTSITVGEYLAAWLERERVRLRPSTWRQRDQYIRLYLTPALGRVVLAKLTPGQVEAMTSALVSGRELAGLPAVRPRDVGELPARRSGPTRPPVYVPTRPRSPQTAASARVILRRALADALRDGLVIRNAASLARPPRIATRDMAAGRDYLDAVQLRRLIEACRDHPLGPLVTVAVTTGLRQGEILGLAWPDVRLGSPAALTVRRSRSRSFRAEGWELAEPKTARSRRTVNLPSPAVDALRVERDRQAAAREAAGDAWADVDGLVFTDAYGRPLVGSTVTHRFHDLLALAKLPRIPFHGLRHTAATAMLTAGVPIKVVSDVLGHSNISITADIYAAVVPELRREAADAMERVLGGGS